MIRSLPAVLVLLFLALPGDAFGRVRAVRTPGVGCTYGLATSIGTVPAAGISRGAINVLGSEPRCTSWSAYSLTSWVTVAREGNVVYADVAPNPTTTPRIAAILIAGIRFELQQEAGSTVSPPIEGNLLKNGGFDTGLSFWGWQDRFPNGTGDVSWSTLDARGNPSSGSIRLRNIRTPEGGPAMQQLQCAAVEGGEIYEYGASFTAFSTAPEAIVALVEYGDETCSTATLSKVQKKDRADVPGTWQELKGSLLRVGLNTRGVLVVIAGVGSGTGTFEVFIDDVYLRKR